MTTKNKVGDKVIILSSWKDNILYTRDYGHFLMYPKKAIADDIINKWVKYRADLWLISNASVIEENVGKEVIIKKIKRGSNSHAIFYYVADSKNRKFNIYHFQCDKVNFLPDRLFEV